MVTALAKPLFEVLARGRSQFREEEAGAALVAGPNHVDMTVEHHLSARKQAVERNVGTDRYGFAGLDGKAVLSNVDADGGRSRVLDLKINQRLQLVARRLATVHI